MFFPIASTINGAKMRALYYSNKLIDTLKKEHDMNYFPIYIFRAPALLCQAIDGAISTEP